MFQRVLLWLQEKIIATLKREPLSDHPVQINRRLTNTDKGVGFIWILTLLMSETKSYKETSTGTLHSTIAHQSVAMAYWI